MPSYRPQAKTSHGSAAYSRASSWVNGRLVVADRPGLLDPEESEPEAEEG